MSSAPGLRERKKIKTRATIRREALRLFLEAGYEETTVEQIAEASEVSPSTFFRYFPTKEHVVFADEYDPLLEQAIGSRPEEEPALVAIRNGIIELCRSRFSEDREELLLRMRLIDRVPALRSRLPQHQRDGSGFIVDALARRMGRAAQDFEVRVLSNIVGTLVAETLLAWASEGGERSLEDMFTSIFDRVAEAFSPL